MIQVNEKSVKLLDESELIVQLLCMGDEEYMTVAQAAEALNVTTANIRMAVKSHGLLVKKVDEHQLSELKQLGVVPLKSPTVNLLPRATVEALVKIVNTPEAWAVYRQMWDIIDGKAAVPAPPTVLTAIKQTVVVLEDHEGRIRRMEAMDGDAVLTSLQVTELEGRMKERLASLSLRGKARTQANGWLRGALKREFGLSRERTWKEMPRRSFAAAQAFVAGWLPTYMETPAAVSPTV